MNIHYLPAVILTITILILLIVISLARRHSWAYLVSGVGLLLTMLSLLDQIGKAGYQTLLFDFTAITPFLSLVLVIVVSMLWSQMYQWLQSMDERKEEYYLLVLFATLGALIMIAANHFASFFLGLELMGLSLVGLVAYVGFDRRGQEAGIKYLVQSAIASALILMGIALLYLQYGSLGFDQMGQTLAQSDPRPFASWVSITGIILILTGLFFKLSVAPCHLWVADLFDGAPLPSAALLSTMSKLATFIALWRMFSIGHWGQFPIIIEIITVVAITSMLVGNLLGLLQTNLLRLMAYSSIAHFGYLLIILLLIDAPSSQFMNPSFTTEAAIFYLVGYMFTLAGVFSVLIQLPKIRLFKDLEGLFWHRPGVAITFGLLVLSLAGIPLTIGFMGKFYLIMTATSHHLWLLLSALVVGSVIGLFYYLRIIMMMVKPSEREDKFADVQIPINGHLLNYLSIFLVIGFGTFPAVFSQLIQHLSR